MEEGRIALFMADYDHQVIRIQEIFTRLDEKATIFQKGSVSPEMVESTGYWLHNLYCAFEDLFKIVASFWENRIDANGSFHQKLIKRMVLNIKGIRPALLSEASYKYLNELRGFRHVFRYAYSYGLDDERVSFLLKRTLDHQNTLKQDIEQFRNRILSFSDDIS